MPAFFGKFPDLIYTLGGRPQIVVDILKRVAFRKAVTLNGSFFGEYSIKDGETPEIIADKLYGDPTYHWVVLLFNQIMDVNFDWPLDSRSLETVISEKYPGYTVFFVEGTITTNGIPPFPRGAIVRNADGSKRAKVVSWDATLYSLTLVPIDQSSSFDASEDIYYYRLNPETGSEESLPTTVAVPTRIVLDSRFAVHHFADDGVFLDPIEPREYRITFTTPYSLGQNFTLGDVVYQGAPSGPFPGPETTPRGTVQAWIPAPIGEPGSTLILRNIRGNPFTTTDGSLVISNISGTVQYTPVLNSPITTFSWQSLYALGGNENVVTNDDHEVSLNERKRTIRLLKPRYLDPVLRDFERLFLE